MALLLVTPGHNLMWSESFLAGQEGILTKRKIEVDAGVNEKKDDGIGGSISFAQPSVLVTARSGWSGAESDMREQ